MTYKVTEHYARGEEKLIAEFNELNEAIFFITQKSSFDEQERKKVIYRIYDDHELLHELNKENISVTHAKYAEGNGDFNNATPFIFKLMIKSMNSLERETIAQFNVQNDANLFVACKFETDHNAMHDNDLFFIFKDKILIDTINKPIIANRNKESRGSGDNQNGSTYRLSPLSTRPTPSGGPPDYWVEKGDVEKGD